MTKSSINEIIKTARKTKGLTQQDLGDEAGISLRTVQRIEKGTEEISGFSLRQICKVLDIPLEEMIMQNVDQISIDNNQIGSIKRLYRVARLFILTPPLNFIFPLIIGASKINKTSLYKENLRFILLFHGIQTVLLLIFLVPILLYGYSTEGSSSSTYIPETNSYNHSHSFKKTHIFSEYPLLFIVPGLIYIIFNFIVTQVKIKSLNHKAF